MTKENKLVEVARSFSRKVNLGNYETIDIFCSQKAEVIEDEAEKISEELYLFCKNEVMKSVGKYLEEKQSKAISMGSEYMKKLNKRKERAKSDTEYSQIEGKLTQEEINKKFLEGTK